MLNMCNWTKETFIVYRANFGAHNSSRQKKRKKRECGKEGEKEGWDPETEAGVCSNR